jgi:hypothetical protein
MLRYLVAAMYIAAVLPILVLAGVLLGVEFFAMPVEERWYHAGVALVVVLTALNVFANWRLDIKKWKVNDLLSRARTDSAVRTRLIVGFLSGSVTSQWLLYGAGIESRFLRIGLGMLLAAFVWPLTFMVRPVFAKQPSDPQQ